MRILAMLAAVSSWAAPVSFARALSTPPSGSVSGTAAPSWSEPAPSAEVQESTGAGGDRRQFFSSAYLNGPILVCNPQVWPGPTETTVMPLLAENREKFKGKTVLDIGTGSGILALFAAQHGAFRVVATDIKRKILACAHDNARRLGLASVIETRHVKKEAPLAFSVVGATETFDIILSAPPANAEPAPFVASGPVDAGMTTDDHIKLGLSIVDGLHEHLASNGTAVLYYPFSVLHNIVAGYAKRSGFVVRHHEARLLPKDDWCVLYNAYAAKVALAENIEPDALRIPWNKQACDGRDVFSELPWRTKGEAAPALWGEETVRESPGMIVIEKQAPRGGPPRP